MFHRIILLVLIFSSIWLVSAQEDRPDARVAEFGGTLNLREFPDTDSFVKDTLDGGTALLITGRTADASWLAVRTSDNWGWVYTQYVEVMIDLDTVPVSEGSTLSLFGVNYFSGVTETTHEIFRRGQALGNRPDVFSKIGDSITASPAFLEAVGEGITILGPYIYLQEVIDFYTITPVRNEDNSFLNESLSAQIGWSSPVPLDPKFADETLCLPDETPLACEYRIVRPSVALIMFGTNDLSYIDLYSYEYWLWQMIEFSIDQGVIPVLSTIPPREDYDAKRAEFNRVVREAALRYDIPLWDYGRVMENMPEFGLSIDGIHPSLPALGYRGTADFREGNLTSGFVVRNLTALHVLDTIWREVIHDNQ